MSLQAESTVRPPGGHVGHRHMLQGRVSALSKFKYSFIIHSLDLSI